jgi:Tol biopolymer transport system component/DNA-binding winged helix-turn-helix (wHTH) protein
MKTTRRYYEFGDFRLVPEDGVLYQNGVPTAELPNKVLNLLLLFLESDGRVLSQDEIMRVIWQDTQVETANLKQSIYLLRKVLGETGANGETFIKTLPRRGYRFLAPVRVVELAVDTAGQNAPFLAVEEHTFSDVTIEEEILETDEAEEKPALLPKKPAYWTGRKALLAGLLSVIVCALAGYGIYRYGFAGKTLPPVNLENASWQKLTNSGDTQFAVISPNGEFVAYLALGENGDQSIYVLNVGTRSKMMLAPPRQVSIWGIAFSPDNSQVYYSAYNRQEAPSTGATLYAVPVFGGEPRRILEPVNSPISFTPDGSRFVYSSFCEDTKSNCLATANAADGSDRRAVATATTARFIAPNFSPDGTRILYVDGEKREDGVYWFIAEAPAGGGDARRITEPRKGRFFGAVWYPDGNGILLNAMANESRQNQLWYVSYPDGQITRITNDLIGYVGLGVSRDGKKIVSVQQTRTNSIWAAALGDGGLSTPPRRLTEDALLIQSMAYAPTGSIVFDSLDNGRMHLWTMNGDGSNRHQISPENIEEQYPAISRDGRLMAFLSNRSGAWQLWRSALDGSNPKQLTFGKDLPGTPKFAARGEKLVFEYPADGDARLVQIPVDGGEITSITDVMPFDWGISADGRRVAYSFSDASRNRTRVAVQSIEDKSDISYLEITPRDFLIFTPDGQSLLTKPPVGVPDSVATVYSYPIAGGEPKKVVSNPPENFYWADLSADGKQIAWVQGKLVSNVVLLTRKN